MCVWGNIGRPGRPNRGSMRDLAAQMLPFLLHSIQVQVMKVGASGLKDSTLITRPTPGALSDSRWAVARSPVVSGRPVGAEDSLFLAEPMARWALGSQRGFRSVFIGGMEGQVVDMQSLQSPTRLKLPCSVSVCKQIPSGYHFVQIV